MTAEQKIRDEFERSGITQQVFADRAGVGLATVNRFLNDGEPRSGRLRKMAAVFGYEIAARKPRSRK